MYHIYTHCVYMPHKKMHFVFYKAFQLMNRALYGALVTTTSISLRLGPIRSDPVRSGPIWFVLSCCCSIGLVVLHVVEGLGGAIYLDSANATVSDCHLERNSAEGIDLFGQLASFGGGLVARGPTCSAAIRYVSFIPLLKKRAPPLRVYPEVLVLYVFFYFIKLLFLFF